MSFVENVLLTAPVFLISLFMKWLALLILLPMALSVAALPNAPFMTNRGNDPAFGVLDVCHTAAPAISPSGDMQCMHEFHRQLLSPTYQETAAMIEIPSQKVLIIFPFEQPPEA
jgi:hypothetical protein